MSSLSRRYTTCETGKDFVTIKSFNSNKLYSDNNNGVYEKDNSVPPFFII